MYASQDNYGGISESHACKDCVWLIILDAELYTTCPGEQVLVVNNAFILYLGLISLGISIPLCSSVVPSEQIVLRICL